MKNGILKMVVLALLLVTCGSTVLAFEGPVPPPLCYPKACDGGNAR